MSQANPARGEFVLQLGNRKLKLRPSFTACAAIERETGQALTQLFSMARFATMRLDTMGAVVRELVVAGAELGSLEAGYDAERLAELIYEEGTPKVSIPLAVVLGAAVTGGVTASGEAKPKVTSGSTTDA